MKQITIKDENGKIHKAFIKGPMITDDALNQALVQSKFLGGILKEINELSYLDMQDGGNILAILEGKRIGLEAFARGLGYDTSKDLQNSGTQTNEVRNPD